MKASAAIFLLVSVFGHTAGTKIDNFPSDTPYVPVSRSIDEKLQQVIESFKEILKNGNETFGIPAMDPFKSVPLKLSYKSGKFDGNLSIESADVFGASNYVVKKANFKMIDLKMSVGLYWSTIKGDIIAYNFHGNLMNLTDIYGKGDAEFTVRDLNVSTDFSLRINSTSKILSMRSMKIKLSLGKLQFYTEGFYNDRDISQVISAILSDMTPRFIEMFQEELTGMLSGIFMDVANDFLSTKTLRELLALIS